MYSNVKYRYTNISKPNFCYGDQYIILKLTREEDDEIIRLVEGGQMSNTVIGEMFGVNGIFSEQKRV